MRIDQPIKEEALARYRQPQIYNIDQGSQFISHAFIEALRSLGIAISMDSKQRVCGALVAKRDVRGSVPACLCIGIVGKRRTDQIFLIFTIDSDRI